MPRTSPKAAETRKILWLSHAFPAKSAGKSMENPLWILWWSSAVFLFNRPFGGIITGIHWMYLVHPIFRLSWYVMVASSPALSVLSPAHPYKQWAPERILTREADQQRNCPKDPKGWNKWASSMVPQGIPMIFNIDVYRLCTCKNRHQNRPVQVPKGSF